jgi:hypothetical protein
MMQIKIHRNDILVVNNDYIYSALKCQVLNDSVYVLNMSVNKVPTILSFKPLATKQWHIHSLPKCKIW